MVANPYAIRYATEARMYSLEILLVASGIVAFQRALEKPTTRPARGRRRRSSRSSLYTQYWSFYLLVVGVRLLVVDGLARRSDRDAARRLLVAMVVGAPRVPAVAADVPLPARAHRHAVGRAESCRASRSATRCATSRAARAARRPTARKAGCSSSSCSRCSSSACSAAGVDDRRIEIDLHVPRERALLAFVGGAGLARRV